MAALLCFVLLGCSIVAADKMTEEALAHITTADMINMYAVADDQFTDDEDGFDEDVSVGQRMGVEDASLLEVYLSQMTEEQKQAAYAEMEEVKDTVDEEDEEPSERLIELAKQKQADARAKKDAKELAKKG